MRHQFIHRPVAIVASKRIPFARAHSAYKYSSNQDMMTKVLSSLVDSVGLKRQKLGEVALGAVIKHSKDWNLARESVLASGLAAETPAFDIQQACGTSLSAAILISAKISAGLIDAGIAGGADSISDLPIVYSDTYRSILMKSARGKNLLQKAKPWLELRPHHFKPRYPSVVEPRTKLSMGESMEKTAKEWHLTRENLDIFALNSHMKAAKAQDNGFFDDLIIEFEGISKDNNIRRDTTMQQLAKLKSAFDLSETGIITAGNSTPLTDGASAILLATEEWALERGLPILSYITHSKIAAVDFINQEGLLMAPAYAVSDMLKEINLSLQDFDFYEIHEAFAAQVLATLKAWESENFCLKKLGRDSPLGTIDHSKINVKGGSVAIGHPFAATGTRILGTLAKLLHQKGSGRGLASICTAGGMGVTAILESS
ncbi:MAG: acetyl-CoA C-acyltransferase [Rhodospirillaceae bacterium]|nr:acetyl-CoA C-acyltransferase [Rhodospirillaceae bacterium]